MLNFAIQTARDAGSILVDRLGRALQVSNKGDIDLVTEADLASEKLIIERIKSHYPRHGILAEESGATDGLERSPGSSDWKWIVDPLDGTTNYAHGYPCFCVSIGLEHAGAIEIAVIYDPMRDEMFAAERGQGWRGERRLREGPGPDDPAQAREPDLPRRDRDAVLRGREAEHADQPEGRERVPVGRPVSDRQP